MAGQYMARAREMPIHSEMPIMPSLDRMNCHSWYVSRESGVLDEQCLSAGKGKE